jgi:hypothetical protein
MYLLHLMVVQQLCGGLQHNYSTKTIKAGHANEQSYVYGLGQVTAAGTRREKMAINLTGNVNNFTIRH